MASAQLFHPSSSSLLHHRRNSKLNRRHLLTCTATSSPASNVAVATTSGGNNGEPTYSPADKGLTLEKNIREEARRKQDSANNFYARYSSHESF